MVGKWPFIRLSERCDSYSGKRAGGWKRRRARALIKAAGEGFGEPCMSLGRSAEGVFDNGGIVLPARHGSHVRGTRTLMPCIDASV